MPYRTQGDCVQEKRAGKWKNLKCYPGEPGKAEAYLKALYANVKDANMENDSNQKPARTLALIETFDFTEAVLDSENRTVRQRIITAGKSKNNRRYDETVLQSAAPLFEGVQTYANHPSKGESKDRPERNIRDLTGWLEGVSYENGALYATRHFTRTQAGNDAWVIVEDIIHQRAPSELIGASINAVGKGRIEKGDNGDVLVVESIEAVNSVDDVTRAGAGGGFERLIASDAGDLTSDLLRSLGYEEWFEARPEYIEKLKREWKTVRLDEETKRLLAEAEVNLKAANDMVANLQSDLIDLQAVESENVKLRRELMLVETLAKIQLPATWKASLRETLLNESDVSKWNAIIETERKKAKSAGGERVSVNGGGQQVTPVIQPQVTIDPVAEARRRLAMATTPEELLRIQESLRK